MAARAAGHPTRLPIVISCSCLVSFDSGSESIDEHEAKEKLIALLKDFESHSERQRRSGEIAYDFTWMWAELGLTRE